MPQTQETPRTRRDILVEFFGEAAVADAESRHYFTYGCCPEHRCPLGVLALHRPVTKAEYVAWEKQGDLTTHPTAVCWDEIPLASDLYYVMDALWPLADKGRFAADGSLEAYLAEEVAFD